MKTLKTVFIIVFAGLIVLSMSLLAQEKKKAFLKNTGKD